MITQAMLETHFDNLASAIGSIKSTDRNKQPFILPGAYNQIVKKMRETHLKKRKIIFIGNGGSASIASHMAEDYTKNGYLRAIAFNDASLITCFANDCGYENVFSEAIKAYGDKDDTLIAISSSGNSKNIINACNTATALGLYVVTLSGFDQYNPLRLLGDLNFYVPTKKGEYGFTEIAHLAVLHSILDMICKERK